MTLIFPIVVVTILALLIFVFIEVVFIKYNGTPVAAPEIPRAPLEIGSGEPLTYVVMGDSTSIGQGTDYEQSYALMSAKHLSKTYRVKFVNTGVSGATIRDVLDKQLEKAIPYKPDIVLIAVGANDATHFTSASSVQAALQKIIDGLIQSNSEVRIVVTRSPAMDSVTRFPWPVKQIMGIRTRQVNEAFEPIIYKNNLTLAPIAESTREAFLQDPSLLSQDKFHPNARGYALWMPVITTALDEALLK